LPQFQPFLATVTTMMDRAGQWADANPRLASSLASLAGGIVVARVGLGALQFAFGSILGPVATLWGWFGRAQALGTMASLLPRLAAGFTLLTGPIGLTVLAIAGVAYGLSLLGADLGLFPAQLDHDPQPVPRGHGSLRPMAGGNRLCASLVYRHWDQIKAATMGMVHTVAAIAAPFFSHGSPSALICPVWQERSSAMARIS
jgi:hypothetical protein